MPKKAETVCRHRIIRNKSDADVQLRPGKIVSQFRLKDGRQVLLRPLKRSDLDSLLEFANAIVKERATNPDLGIVALDRRVSKEDERKFLNSIIAGVKKRDLVSVGAFVGDDMAGHCDVRRRKLKDIDHTGVLGVIVRDGYRGAGLGGRMISEALKEARRLGVWLVELSVFANNAMAVHLYEKLGFKVVGVVPDKIVRAGRHIDEIVMYTDLRKR